MYLFSLKKKKVPKEGNSFLYVIILDKLRDNS
jgi:hypothetical protein